MRGVLWPNQCREDAWVSWDGHAVKAAFQEGPLVTLFVSLD